MIAVYMGLKHFHLLTIVISITLFLLRFFWKWRNSAMLMRRWIKFLPHLNDTLLLFSGISLIGITHFYPFTPQGLWMTEKLFAVLLYIGLGYIALSRRSYSHLTRMLAFIAALVCLSVVIKLAVTKSPLLMGYI